MDKHDNYYGLAMAKFYDQITNSGYYNYESIVRTIESILGDRRKVLEIGIGTGNIGIPLAKHGFDVDGIDPSWPMLCVAREKVDKEGLRIGLYRQDCLELDLPCKYDAILSHGGVPVYIRSKDDLIFESYLPTLEQNYEALQGVIRHLNGNGLFIINIQKEHHAQETLQLGNALQYSSTVEYSDNSVKKTHYVTAGEAILMEQTFEIRRFGRKAIDDILKQIGFRVQGEDETGSFYVMRVID